MKTQFQKHLHSITTDGVCIQTRIGYNTNTNNYSLYTGFSRNWHGEPTAQDNPTCSNYLGCYVAERVLANVFKNVEVMPTSNPGYDFICGRGYKIDCKSTCRRVRDRASDSWVFNIRHNTIADHFLCLAFDNRSDLKPEHIWLIPGVDVNTKSSIGIAESTIHKWDHYKLDKLDDITQCCDTIRQT